MYGMSKSGHAFKIPGLDKFALSAVVAGQNVYRKELIYPGQFSAPDLDFEITREELDVMRDAGNLMLSNGVGVPVPLGHSESAEDRRGECIGYEVAHNPAKDRDSLYGFIKFDKTEYEALASSDVSIYRPKSFVDGKGRTYLKAIRHIALTDYPVIPGLDKFEAIVASLVSPTKEPKRMTVESILESLELTAPDGADEAAMEQVVIDHVAAQAARITELEEKLAAAGVEEGEEVEASEEEGAKPEAAAITAGFLPMARELREGKIDRLVEQRKITPAQAKSLKAQYCSDASLTLSLSPTAGKRAAASFDTVIATFAQNTPAPDKSRTAPQVLRLSNGERGKAVSPLRADAERRAAEAAKRAGRK